jgi:hypothetical protein
MIVSIAVHTASHTEFPQTPRFRAINFSFMMNARENEPGIGCPSSAI